MYLRLGCVDSWRYHVSKAVFSVHSKMTHVGKRIKIGLLREAYMKNSLAIYPSFYTGWFNIKWTFWFLTFIFKTFWYSYVVGMSIEKLFDMWRNDEILKYYVICAAVSALSWLSQFCTSKNRFRENSKFRHFVTYQITFLLTCQPHKLKIVYVM